MKLQKAGAAYGRASLSKVLSRRRSRRVAEVEEVRERYERLCRQRFDAPREIRLGDVSDGYPVKLTCEGKLLTDTIKMCAYDVETQLTQILDGVLRRNELEGRAVVREICQSTSMTALGHP